MPRIAESNDFRRVKGCDVGLAIFTHPRDLKTRPPYFTLVFAILALQFSEQFPFAAGCLIRYHFATAETAPIDTHRDAPMARTKAKSDPKDDLAVRPFDLDHVLVTNVEVREMLDGFDQRGWLLHDSCSCACLTRASVSRFAW